MAGFAGPGTHRRVQARRLRLLVAGCVAAAGFGLSQRAAQACTCLAPGSPTDELRSSDSVFVGRFVDNAGDKEYLIDAGNTGRVFGTPTYIPGNPRLYGVRFSGRF